MNVSYFCAQCQKLLDESQTKKLAAGTGFVRACATCGTLARTETSQVVAHASRPLAIEMVLAYAFPFRPASLIALGPMALLVALSCWSIHGLILGLVVYALMLAMMFAIVRATAAGDDQITVDSIFLHRGEAAGIIGRYIVLVLVCASPVIVVWWLGLAWPFWSVAMLAGYLYFPAGLITSSQHASTLFDAIVGYRVIAAMPVPYFTAVAVMTPAALAWFASPFIAEALVDVGPLASIVSRVVSLFAFAIVARICGIFLREEL